LRASGQALRESEKRYRYISEMSSDYITRISVDANGQMSVNYVTEEYARVMGYSMDELKTPDMWHKVVYPDDMDTLSKFSLLAVSKSAIRGDKPAKDRKYSLDG